MRGGRGSEVNVSEPKPECTGQTLLVASNEIPNSNELEKDIVLDCKAGKDAAELSEVKEGLHQ